MTEILESALPLLLDWYGATARPLPWREEITPYRVWISEIMLQQTRVEAVIPYYQRFLSAFPDVKSLAEAPDGLLMKCWEGLGYYSRARNLRRAAEKIVTEYNGVFPADYESLLSLPGVGPYTAGAIGSIAFGLPTPAVDGNVLRILARLGKVGEDVLSPAVKNSFTAALAAVYPKGKKAGVLTQAFMELGQRHCLPNGAPLCEGCPLSAICRAHLSGEEENFPVRTPKKGRKVLKKTVLLLHCNGRFALRQRPKEGLLAELWEFPNTDGFLSPEEAADYIASLGLSPLGVTETEGGKHIFTHLEWHMKGYFAECACETPPAGLVFATPEEIRDRYAIATAFRPFRKFTVQK